MKDTHDLVDELIVKELLWHYENFLEPQRIPFISFDPGEEDQYVKKMRKSLKRVIKFYGGEL